MANRITRLAPSPTGALHLGNARTFLINWAIARQRGWTIRLRIEDLDGPRIKSGAADSTIRVMRTLGLDWDGPILVQSDDLAPYREAMERLAAAGRVFPCELSRTEIVQAASAPHEGEHEIRFPPELRPAEFPRRFDRPEVNWRLTVPEAEVLIEDEIAGPTGCRPWLEVGDFVVWTARGAPSYQLAVVVDDARQGVTDVIRGDDLLPSAGRQRLLYEALGLGPAVTYWHLPLVRGEDGRRLAKRHGDTRLVRYLEEGVAPERIVGLLAAWSGVEGPRRAMSAAEFAEVFEVGRLPRGDVTFTNEDDQWLLER